MTERLAPGIGDPNLHQTHAGSAQPITMLLDPLRYRSTHNLVPKKFTCNEILFNLALGGNMQALVCARLLEMNHRPNRLAFMHQIKGFIDPLQGHGVGHKGV